MAAAALLTTLPLHLPTAQITQLDLEPDAAVISCASPVDRYLVLVHGAVIAAATTPVQVAMSAAGDSTELCHEADDLYAAPCGFYAVWIVPLDAPLDLDGDGIDDLFEMGLWFLDPLDPADAELDEDLDGVCNLDEYLQGRSLTVGAVAGTAANVGLEVFAPPAG